MIGVLSSVTRFLSFVIPVSFVIPAKAGTQASMEQRLKFCSILKRTLSSGNPHASLGSGFRRDDGSWGARADIPQ